MSAFASRMKQRAHQQRKEGAERRRVLGEKHPLSELHRAGKPHDTTKCPTCRCDLIRERAQALWGPQATRTP